MTPIYTFHARTDLTVMRVDPEMADYDNPRGERYGYAGIVVAEDSVGNRREFFQGAWWQEADALSRAEATAKALTVRLETLGKLPLAFDCWAIGRPAYGSEAYIAYGAADDLALERDEG